MSTRQQLSFEFSIHGHVEAAVPEAARFCLFAYHGYAEAAEAPVEALLAAGFEDALILAPMAPHHFYNRQGKVVASWMTRFERERRIEELLRHARGLWDLACRSWGELPLYVFGFSQGGANAYRVSLLSGLPVRRCFVLGADQPPEVRELDASPESPGLTLLTGRQDDAGIREVMENDHRTLAERGYNVDRFMLEGGHEYLPEALSLVQKQIRGDS